MSEYLFLLVLRLLNYLTHCVGESRPSDKVCGGGGGGGAGSGGGGQINFLCLHLQRVCLLKF